LEIQRHIKGFLTRKKIRPILLQRLTMVIKREDPGRFTKGNSTKSIGITNKSIHFSVYILDGKKLLDGFSYLAKRLRKHKN
jgi:hypothetical protein